MSPEIGSRGEIIKARGFLVAEELKRCDCEASC
jgi:hypothetical protein